MSDLSLKEMAIMLLNAKKVRNDSRYWMFLSLLHRRTGVSGDILVRKIEEYAKGKD